MSWYILVLFCTDIVSIVWPPCPVKSLFPLYLLMWHKAITGLLNFVNLFYLFSENTPCWCFLCVQTCQPLSSRQPFGLFSTTTTVNCNCFVRFHPQQLHAFFHFAYLWCTIFFPNSRLNTISALFSCCYVVMPASGCGASITLLVARQFKIS